MTNREQFAFAWPTLCIAVVASLLSWGCNSGPSDADIKSAVTEVAVKSKGLNPLANDNSCGVLRGNITEVTKVEVTQRGEHNDKDNYWPAKLTLSGKCEAQWPRCGPTKNEPCPPEHATFEGIELEVRLKKDDYGKWTVEVVGGDASPADGEAHTSAASTKPPDIKIDPKAVTEIAITAKSGKTATLKKVGETWRAGDAAANEKNVASLIEGLGKMKATAVIATKVEADVLAKYELDDKHAVHLVVRSGGKVLVDLKFGKGGSRGQMALLNGQVVAVTGYSAVVFNRPAAQWRDNTVLTFEPKEVTTVVIENSNGKFTFERKGDAWTSTLSAFDPSAVDKMLAAMKALRATGFAAVDAATGLDDAKKSGGVVTITLGETEKVLKFGKVEKGSNRYAQLQGSDTIYVVSSWAADWATADAKKFAK